MFTVVVVRGFQRSNCDKYVVCGWRTESSMAFKDGCGIVLFMYLCDEIRCTTTFISVESFIGGVETKRRETGQSWDDAHHVMPCAGKGILIDLYIYSLNIKVKCRVRTSDSSQKNGKNTTDSKRIPYQDQDAGCDTSEWILIPRCHTLWEMSNSHRGNTCPITWLSLLQACILQ